MKLIALSPIQHDNKLYAQDAVLEIESPEDAQTMIAAGSARIAPDNYPLSDGTEIVRKPIKEKDKLVPTAAQIAEAEAAANEPILTPEAQFEKGAIASSVVAAGDTSKIKEAQEHRRK